MNLNKNLNKQVRFFAVTTFVLLLGITNTLNAAQKQFLPQEFSRVSIAGALGHYVIKGAPKGSPFKIVAAKLADYAIKSSIEDNTLHISQEVGVSAQDAQYEILWPQDIHGSVVVESGTIQINEVSAPLLVRVLKGNINLQKTHGNMQLFAQKGSISISDHNGDLDIESFLASVTVKQSTGRLELKNFSGESLIDNQTGRTTIESYSGAQKLNNSKGSLYFSLGRGSINVSAFIGRIEGDNKEASVALTPKDEVEIDIRSNSGKVIVNLPTASGAYLNLSTINGDLVPLLPVKPYREDKYKMAKGRVKGEPHGHVNIRGDDVTIVVR